MSLAGLGPWSITREIAEVVAPGEVVGIDSAEVHSSAPERSPLGMLGDESVLAFVRPVVLIDLRFPDIRDDAWAGPSRETDHVRDIRVGSSHQRAITAQPAPSPLVGTALVTILAVLLGR
jgi:hypothetical protein